MPSTINFLRLIADPTRLRVLLVLEQEELSVAELQEILAMGQSRISSHLAQLKRAGAVVDRRAGKNVYYGLKSLSRNGARGRVQELVQTLAREIPETARDRTALKLTLRKRQDKAPWRSCSRKTRAKSLRSIIRRRWSSSRRSWRRNMASATSSTGSVICRSRPLLETVSIWRFSVRLCTMLLGRNARSRARIQF